MTIPILALSLIFQEVLLSSQKKPQINPSSEENPGQEDEYLRPINGEKSILETQESMYLIYSD